MYILLKKAYFSEMLFKISIICHYKLLESMHYATLCKTIFDEMQKKMYYYFTRVSFDLHDNLNILNTLKVHKEQDN